MQTDLVSDIHPRVINLQFFERGLNCIIALWLIKFLEIHTITRASVGAECVSSPATTGIGSNGVCTNLRTSISVEGTFINI